MVSGITPCAQEYKWIVYFGEPPTCKKIPTSRGLSGLFPTLAMRAIRLVIALLHPRDQCQHPFHGIRPQG